MAVPDFLIWHCAGCGAAAEGKTKPCNCTTNVGTRKGPNGKREETWWDEPSKFDAAWDIVRDDPELARARQKLSIHEIRHMIRAVAKAFQ